MKKYMNDLATILTAAVSGGVISALLSYFAARRTAKKDDFSVVVDRWEKDNERLRHEMDEMTKNHNIEKKEMQGEIEELKKEVYELRGKVSVLEGISKNG